MKITVLFPLLFLGAAVAQVPETRWQRSAQRKAELARGVTWLTHESVTCFSPDAGLPTPVTFTERGGELSFTVPSTRLYSMAVIAQ